MIRPNRRATLTVAQTSAHRPQRPHPGRWAALAYRPMTTRQHYPCEVEYLTCPRCARPIRRVTVIGGHFLAQCEAGPNANRCGQHMHIIATNGLAWVAEISHEEAAALRELGDVPARDVYRALGLVGKRRAG